MNNFLEKKEVCDSSPSILKITNYSTGAQYIRAKKSNSCSYEDSEYHYNDTIINMRILKKTPKKQEGLRKVLQKVFLFIILIVAIEQIFIFYSFKEFYQIGKLFPNNHHYQLDESDIKKLYLFSIQNKEYSFEELIRFSVNEIYAQKGFLFPKESQNLKFYNSYNWYLSLEKKESINWDEFNEMEKYNLRFLLDIEKGNYSFCTLFL